MRLLITRPAGDAQAAAEALEARGHAVLACPLITVMKTGEAKPNLAAIQAFIVTDGDGAHALSEAVGVRTFPVFCDSLGTAAALASLGFKDVRSANGDATTLAKLIEKSLTPKLGGLVYVCSTSAPMNLHAMLSNMGFAVRMSALYEVKRADTLPPQITTALKSDSLDGAVFFSADEARAFAQLVQRAELDAATRRLIAIVAAPVVAAPLTVLKFAKVATAPKYDPTSVVGFVSDVEQIRARDAAEAAEAAQRLKDREEAERQAAAQRERERQEAERLAAERRAREQQEAARLAKEREAAEKTAAERREADRIESEKRAAEQRERERQDAERLALEREATAKLAVEKREADRIAAEKHAAEERERKRQEAERLTKERAAAEKRTAEQREKERIAAEARAAEQQERDRQEAERRVKAREAAEKVAAEQRERDRQEAERRAKEREAAEKVAAEKREADRIAAENRAAERRVWEQEQAAVLAEARHAAAKQAAEDHARARAEAERLEQERLAAEKRAAAQYTKEWEDAKHLAAEKRARELEEVERLEAERRAAVREAEEQRAKARAEALRIENERLAAERLIAQQRDQERREAKRIADEQRAKERAEAERLDAERRAAEKLASEKLAAEKKAAEHREGERIAAEKAAVEKAAAEKAAAEKIAADQAAAAVKATALLVTEQAVLPITENVTTENAADVAHGTTAGEIAAPDARENIFKKFATFMSRYRAQDTPQTETLSAEPSQQAADETANTKDLPAAGHTPAPDVVVEPEPVVEEAPAPVAITHEPAQPEPLPPEPIPEKVSLWTRAGTLFGRLHATRRNTGDAPAPPDMRAHMTDISADLNAAEPPAPDILAPPEPEPNTEPEPIYDHDIQKTPDFVAEKSPTEEPPVATIPSTTVSPEAETKRTDLLNVDAVDTPDVSPEDTRPDETKSNAELARSRTGGRSARLLAEDAADARALNQRFKFGGDTAETEKSNSETIAPDATTAPPRGPARRRGSGAVPMVAGLAVLAGVGYYTSSWWMPRLQSSPAAQVATSAAPQAPTDTMAALQTRADALAADVVALNTRMAAVEQRPGTGDPAALAELSKRIAVLESAPTVDATAPEGLSTSVTNQARQLASVTARVATLEAALGNAAKLEDLATRLSALEGKSAEANSVLALGDRLAALEKRDAVAATALVLATAQLREATQSGRNYAVELETVGQLAARADVPFDAASLKADAVKGLTQVAVLKSSFPEAATKIVRADALPDATTGWVRRMLDRVYAIISVRPFGTLEGDSVGAVVARAEQALKNDNLAQAVTELGALKGAAADAATPWLAPASAYVNVAKTIEDLSARSVGAMSALNRTAPLAEPKAPAPEPKTP